VDRLGRTGIERAVLRYLRPRASQAATRFRPPKRFDGWATIRVKVLAKPQLGDRALPVSPSPIAGDATRLEDNIYHAHITLPEGDSHLSNALLLRELFTQYGDVHSETSQPNDGSEDRGGIWSRVLGLYRKVSGILRRN
jgi:hypothetical protein